MSLGPAEILVVALVALIVFGPERLPVMARKAGRFISGLRAMWESAQRDVAQHIDQAREEIDLREEVPHD